MMMMLVVAAFDSKEFLHSNISSDASGYLASSGGWMKLPSKCRGLRTEEIGVFRFPEPQDIQDQSDDRDPFQRFSQLHNS